MLLGVCKKYTIFVKNDSRFGLGKMSKKEKCFYKNCYLICCSKYSRIKCKSINAQYTRLKEHYLLCCPDL